MRWPEGFIAVDWGTTNRRAYLIDGDGRCVNEFEDGKGVLSIPDGGFPAAIAEIRARLGDLPLLMAGMVGSNRGWVEVPYVQCPAGIEDLARAVIWPDEFSAIVPGVSFLDGERADVMRGEEVQLLGALSDGSIPSDCLVCHPGTHNKWVRVSGGRIASFRTVMTGEMFNLLRKHSILSDSLDNEAMWDAPFREGVRQGLGSNALTSDLFSVRARVLLGRLEKAHAVSFASGLLIGYDVRTGLADRHGEPLIVMGRAELTMLYEKAFEEAGADCTSIDGEGSFIAGAKAIAERIT